MLHVTHANTNTLLWFMMTKQPLFLMLQHCKKKHIHAPYANRQCCFLLTSQTDLTVISYWKGRVHELLIKCTVEAELRTVGKRGHLPTEKERERERGGDWLMMMGLFQLCSLWTKADVPSFCEVRYHYFWNMLSCLYAAFYVIKAFQTVIWSIWCTTNRFVLLF